MADTQLNRRRFLQLIAASGAGALLAACGAPGAQPPAAQPTAPPAAPAAEPTAAPAAAEPTAAPAAAEPTAAPAAEPAAGGILNGVTLPADAAPPEYQVWVNYFDNTAPYTSNSFMESVYNNGGFGAINDLLGESLVRLNKDFQVQPAAALKWSSNSEGTVWTFELDPNLVWSDGTPLTADDYVATFRYAADPKHAWDFAWYYSAPGEIKNWDAVVAGKMPLEELGVKADGPNKLIVETATPAPFLPAKIFYSSVLQKAALEKHGSGQYNSDPATSVSAGPFILKEWKKGERLVYEANPTYKGSNKPLIQKVISIGAKPETMFAGYQAGEVDYLQGSQIQTADNEIIAADPDLLAQVHPVAGDFRTDYIYFDCQNPPFNDVKVRQAFGHIVDRDTIIKTIITPSLGIPAYSFLMPGFPAANSEGLKEIQSFDPAKAKSLLAEAGFPDGKGFPKLTLWLRNESQTRQAMAQAIAATIKQELGIEVEVSNKDYKVYMDALNAKPTQIQFGMVSYGIDFLDPSNMLGVWLSTGRHNWWNKEYDKMVNDAAALIGDDTKRTQMFQDAERLLVEEAPAVWIYHRTRADLIKPYVGGDFLKPNKAGSSGLQWPDFSVFSDVMSTLHITSEVTKVRTEPPK
jgi:ABC-type transport system substrate-binding protein